MVNCQVIRRGMMEVMVSIVLLCLAGLLDIATLFRLLRALRMLQVTTNGDPVVHDLPTVSVCIAARNETHAMTQCLERVVASDYPKLEVIVLDDGSRDNTSLLIKSFAHAGVRFIEGKELPHGWLGKNYAQSILAKEASGDVVFFIDVDTLIEVRTISRIVDYMQSKQAKMVSVIPMRAGGWHASLLFATMRHFWTVIRFSPHRPKAVANAWLIYRDVLLERFASDETLAASMQVETTIAKYLSQQKQFRLIVSDPAIGLRYEKRWSSQVETSIRLLYPQRDKNIAKVILTTAALLIAIAPYIVVFFSLWALIPIVLQFIIAMIYLSHMWSRFSIVGALLAPYTLIQETILLLVSTYKYHFGNITWKGRPIAKSD